MIQQLFPPGKVSSCCPFICWWKVNFGARFIPIIVVQTSSNKQGLFEIQKKDNRTTFGYSCLFPIPEKTGAAMHISRCGQVRKGFQVFAFRVVPGRERGWWWQLWFEHLSTFPWGTRSPWLLSGPLLPRPPIVTKPVLKGRAHVPRPPFWRVSFWIEEPPLNKRKLSILN